MFNERRTVSTEQSERKSHAAFMRSSNESAKRFAVRSFTFHWFSCIFRGKKEDGSTSSSSEYLHGVCAGLTFRLCLGICVRSLCHLCFASHKLVYSRFQQISSLVHILRYLWRYLAPSSGLDGQSSGMHLDIKTSETETQCQFRHFHYFVTWCFPSFVGLSQLNVNVNAFVFNRICIRKYATTGFWSRKFM